MSDNRVSVSLEAVIFDEAGRVHKLDPSQVLADARAKLSGKVPAYPLGAIWYQACQIVMVCDQAKRLPTPQETADLVRLLDQLRPSIANRA